jgi:transposase-like protein
MFWRITAQNKRPRHRQDWAVYPTLGDRANSRKEVLGLSIERTEGINFWLHVLTNFWLNAFN